MSTTPEPTSERIPTPSFDPLTCDICGKETNSAVLGDGRTVCEDCSARIEAYEARLAARYTRLAAAANKATREGQATYDHAHKMASVIPFGQPILVGHYSEGRDRRYRDRIHNTFGRAFAHFERAEELKRRSQARSKGISSDDPAAVVKLRDELAKLEALQAHMVKVNKVVKKLVKPSKFQHIDHSGTIEQINARIHAEQDRKRAEEAAYPALAPELAKQADISEDEAQRLLKPDFAGRIGYPDYATRNNGANIRRIKGRIEDLSKQQAKAETLGNEQIAYSGDIKLIVNREENRVQIAFPGKPAASTIALLKQNGFKWAPSVGVWQRMLGNGAQYHAEYILKVIGATKTE